MSNEFDGVGLGDLLTDKELIIELERAVTKRDAEIAELKEKNKFQKMWRDQKDDQVSSMIVEIASLQASNGELVKALERFCTLSNGLSIWSRDPVLAEKTVMFDEYLHARIAKLYDHQIDSEATLFKLKSVKGEEVK